MDSYHIFARFYDRLTGNIEYDKRADFIRTLLVRNGLRNADVLDLACGTGTLTLKLAGMGYEMIGVDLSADMLSLAQEKMFEQNQHILFLNQNMTGLDLYDTVDACICTSDSLNHLDSFEQFESTIKRISLFMNEGGIFIFDVNTVYKHQKILADNTFVYDLDEIYCVWQNTLKENNCVEISLDLFVPGADKKFTRFEEHFCENAYNIDSISSVLVTSGFEVLDIYDDYSEKLLTDTTERAVFVARKKGKK